MGFWAAEADIERVKLVTTGHRRGEVRCNDFISASSVIWISRRAGPRITSAIITDDSANNRLIVGIDDCTTADWTGRSWCRVVYTKPIVAGILVCLEDNVVSLANIDLQISGLVGLDRHKVCFDDSEWMTVQRDVEEVVHGRVDEAKAVFFASLNADSLILAITSTVDHCSVHQDGVWWRWWTRCVHHTIQQLIDRLVIPVGQRKHSEVLVIVCGSWSINHDRTDNTLAVLCGVVRMIPSSAILSCSECVRLRRAWRNRALRHSVCAVLFIGVELSDTVPVQRCTIVCEAIMHIDGELVAPVYMDHWTWSLSIDQLARLAAMAVRVAERICQVQII